MKKYVALPLILALALAGTALAADSVVGALDNSENYSRAVRYRIDAESMTMEQVWQHGKELGAKYFVESMSGVQVLEAEKGAYLLTFAICNAEYDEDPESEDYRCYLHYIEGDQPVREMRAAGITYRGLRTNLYDAFGSFDPTVETRLYDVPQ